MIQYTFRNRILSKDTPSFQRRDWFKNERDNEFEMRCSMSNTKYGECEWDGLWSVKWMRWKLMNWTLVHEMNIWTLVYEMNEMKVTRQIFNNTGRINPIVCIVCVFSPPLPLVTFSSSFLMTSFTSLL